MGQGVASYGRGRVSGRSLEQLWVWRHRRAEPGRYTIRAPYGRKGYLIRTGEELPQIPPRPLWTANIGNGDPTQTWSHIDVGPRGFRGREGSLKRKSQLIAISHTDAFPQSNHRYWVIRTVIKTVIRVSGVCFYLNRPTIRRAALRISPGSEACRHKTSGVLFCEARKYCDKQFY